MKLPVSVIILTYNEEANITGCLESVSDWAEEVFVVDSGSSDRTAEIAAARGIKPRGHPFENYARQRNWAQRTLPLKSEWVFHLDADERVSRELAAEMGDLFSSGTDCDGFLMPRKTFFRGRWIRHGGHYPVYHLRLFKKDKGKCEERSYDQHFLVDGKTLRMNGDIINIIEPNLEQWKERHRTWALEEARAALSRENGILSRFNYPIGRRRWMKDALYYRMPLFIRPALYFIYRYFLRLGFLDGPEGLVFHFWHGFWFRLQVDLKIRELRKGVKW